MFGLTKREQRWKAEQRAAETLLSFAGTALQAAVSVREIEAQEELVRLRAETAELRKVIADMKADLELSAEDGLPSCACNDGQNQDQLPSCQGGGAEGRGGLFWPDDAADQEAFLEECSPEVERREV